MNSGKSFNCFCCGECCRGDMHVYLNPDDLCLMAEFLGFGSTKELFDASYLIIDRERNDAPMPRIRFSKGPSGCCPFLENRLIEDSEDLLSGDTPRLAGLCRLHPEHKPLICWLAPQHRTVDLDHDDEVWGYIPPVQGCPGCGIGKPLKSSSRFSARLDSEKDFFRKLADLLDGGTVEEEIIDSLYYFNTDEHSQTR